MSYKSIIRNPSLDANQHNILHVVPRDSFKLSSIMLAFYTFTIVAWSQASKESATYSKVTGLALIYVFAAEYALHRGEKLRFPKGLTFLALFVLWNATSLFWARNSALATATTITLLQLLVFSIAVVNILILRASLLPAIVGFLGGMLWAIISAVKSNNYNFIQTTTTRFGSVLTNPNLYAIALTLGLLLILYLYPKSSKFIQIILLVCIVLIVQQIFFFSGSRKGMLAVIFILSMYFAVTFGFNVHRSPKYTFMLLICLTIVYVGADWLITNTPYSDRLINYQGETSYRIRESLIDFGLEKWKQEPIIGYGSDQYRVLSGQSIGNAAYAHNNYVEVLVNNGVVGLILYYYLYIYILVGNWKLFSAGSLSSSQFAWSMTTLLLLLLWDFALVSYVLKPHWMLFGMLIAHQETAKSRIARY